MCSASVRLHFRTRQMARNFSTEPHPRVCMSTSLSGIPSGPESASKEPASSRIRRKLLAVVLTLGMLGLVFLPDYGLKGTVKREPATEESQTVMEKRLRVRRVETDSLTGRNDPESHCSVRNCMEILCSHLTAIQDPGRMAARFIESRFKIDCANAKSAELVFTKCVFPSNRLPENWLETDISIGTLTFTDCSLSEITDDAFSGVIYEQTTKLSIIGNKILSLRSAAFRNLPNLHQLLIRDNPLKQAELNLLAGSSSTLGTLELESALDNAEILRNITGGSTLPNLQLLSLNRNSIPTVDPSIFSGLPQLRSLYIQNSKVQMIQPRAFDPMAQTLQTLDLNDNAIATLPEALFDPILTTKKAFTVMLEKNPWHCDCKLKWMQDLIRSYPNALSQVPTCKSPDVNYSKSFTQANFCNETSTDPPPATETEPNTSVSEEDRGTTGDDNVSSSEGMISVSCSIGRDYWTEGNEEFFSVNELEPRLDFRKRYPAFAAREVENGLVLVHLPDLNSSIGLVWFESEEAERSVRCARNIRNSYLLRNLRPQTSYTVCLLESTSNAVSPLNCLAVTTHPSHEERTWLTNGDKPVVISVSAVFLFAFSVISGICAFLLVRRYPSLLRGSRRIVMVKRRTDVDAIVLPKGLRFNAEKPGCNESAPPLLPNDAHVDGYVTPLPPVATGRKGSRASLTSLQSDEISYVSEVEPTMAQLTAWRLKRLKSQTESEKISLPPLPPRPHVQIPSLSSTVDSKGAAAVGYSSGTI